LFLDASDNPDGTKLILEESLSVSLRESALIMTKTQKELEAEAAAALLLKNQQQQGAVNKANIGAVFSPPGGAPGA
jgi:hypothetical protein